MNGKITSIHIAPPSHPSRGHRCSGFNIRTRNIQNPSGRGPSAMEKRQLPRCPTRLRAGNGYSDPGDDNPSQGPVSPPRTTKSRPKRSNFWYQKELPRRAGHLELGVGRRHSCRSKDFDPLDHNERERTEIRDRRTPLTTNERLSKNSDRRYVNIGPLSLSLSPLIGSLYFQ